MNISNLWNQNVKDNVVAGLLLALILFFMNLIYRFLFPRSNKKFWIWCKNRFSWSFSFIFNSIDIVDQNDIWWEKLFRLNKFRYEITITPINTFYWRFGFRLSKNK